MDLAIPNLLVPLMHPVDVAAIIAFETCIPLCERTGRHLDVIAATLPTMVVDGPCTGLVQNGDGRPPVAVEDAHEDP